MGKSMNDAIAAKKAAIEKAKDRSHWFTKTKAYEWGFVAGMIGFSIIPCINGFIPSFNPGVATGGFHAWNTCNFIAPLALVVIGLILLIVGCLNKDKPTISKMFTGFYGLGVTCIIGFGRCP